MEKQVQEVVLHARDEGLYNAIADCGTGGFFSAVGGMTEGLGAAVQLQNITLKYPGLSPWEIWLSEAQEWVLLAVPEANLARVEAICVGQDVEATVLGRFVDDGRLTLHDGDKLVADLSMALLYEGIPTRRTTAVWEGGEKALGQRSWEAEESSKYAIRNTQYNQDFKETLLKLLAHPDIHSKEDVQQSSLKGVALANGICSSYNDFDPYKMAWVAVDKALRKVAAVGADPEQVLISDHFLGGISNLPDRLGALVRCMQGCFDAAVAYETHLLCRAKIVSIMSMWGQTAVNRPFRGRC